MSYGNFNSTIYSTNQNALEYNKFIEIIGDSRFPAVSVTKTSYDDNITRVENYNKNALLTYLVNAQDIQVSLSGGNFSIGTGVLAVSGGVFLTQTAGVSGLVSVTNTVPISSATFLPVSGNVSVTNVIGVSGGVAITNVVPVSGGPITGQVIITNTVPVSGTVLTTPGNITNWDVISASLAQGVYTTMPSNLARVMSVTNSTGYTVYIKKATSGTAFALLNNNAIDLNLIANTNEVAIRQVDSVSPLVITAIYNY